LHDAEIDSGTRDSVARQRVVGPSGRPILRDRPPSGISDQPAIHGIGFANPQGVCD